MLGARIRRLRKSAKIGNRELDRLAQITPGHSWLIENGKRNNPELKTLAAVAEALGCSVGYLIGEAAPPAAQEVKAAVSRARERLSGVGIGDGIGITPG